MKDCDRETKLVMSSLRKVRQIPPTEQFILAKHSFFKTRSTTIFNTCFANGTYLLGIKTFAFTNIHHIFRKFTFQPCWKN